ncbi:MAG: hypothetical protein ACOX1P_18920 [Thermoguttaceae bacterium]
MMVTLPPVVEKEKASWSSIFSMIPLAVAVLPEKTKGGGFAGARVIVGAVAEAVG